MFLGGGRCTVLRMNNGGRDIGNGGGGGGGGGGGRVSERAVPVFSYLVNGDDMGESCRWLTRVLQSPGVLEQLAEVWDVICSWHDGAHCRTESRATA